MTLQITKVPAMNDILIRSPRLQSTVSTHRHEFHSSQVRFLMQNETNKQLQNIDSIWLPDGWTACVSTKHQIYAALAHSFVPLRLPPSISSTSSCLSKSISVHWQLQRLLPTLLSARRLVLSPSWGWGVRLSR